MFGEDTGVGLFGGRVLHHRLMAGIVHEFNNLNASVMSRLQLVLMRELKGDQDERYLRESVEMLERSARVAEMILQLSTDRLPEKELILPEVPLRRALTMQEPELTWGGIETHLNFSGGPCWLYSELLTHAVGNLLVNSLREIGGRKERWIAVECKVEGEWLSIRVSDSGKGYTPEKLEELACPLTEYRSAPEKDRQRKYCRFGLGLFLTRWIVLVHGGTIAFANHDEGGAICTMRLPAGLNGPQKLRARFLWNADGSDRVDEDENE